MAFDGRNVQISHAVPVASVFVDTGAEARVWIANHREWGDDANRAED